MHTLEAEIQELHAEGSLDEAMASRASALDRGEIFSLHAELRATMYAGVLLVTGGVGVILARNLDRLGPTAIVLVVALIAVACAAPALRARRAGRDLSVAGDYLLLLAVLLASADLGYAERQFTLLGPLWPQHLLLLALVHAWVAYAFGSPLVLAASLTALAGWFGVGGGFAQALDVFPSSPELGGRALACAAVIIAWRFADRRARPESNFSDVFDHFATNIAFWGALAWCLEPGWLLAGLPLTLALSILSVRRGLRDAREAFVVYGVLYAALGTCFVVVPTIQSGTAVMWFVLMVVCAAAVALWQLRRAMREPAP
jgi:hypothetical protein